MNLGWVSLLLVFALLAAGVACAADGDYRLGPEDVVAITVLYHPEFSVEMATIRPDGKINYPLAGDIEAAGKTVAEVAEIIRQAVGRDVREPRVSVRLVSRYISPVYVLGAVRTPGAVEVKDTVTVAEAIALAGGLDATAAPRYGLIIRPGGEQTDIDVAAAMSGAAPMGKMLLKPGDTLVVSAQFLVSVVGEVVSPGRYPIERGDKVGDALAAAGGLTQMADARAARLVRADGQTLALDLDAMLNRGQMDDNHLLEPGDVILAPTLEQRVTVVGAVLLPGKYDFDDGERVSDALARGGGAAEDARLRSAKLIRRDGSSVTVDLEAILQRGEQEQNLLLAHGDTLVVPRKLDKVGVIGMVTTPGLVALEPNMTVIDAIAAAGGWLTDEAKPEHTLLWREQEGKPTLTVVNARALMLGDTDLENPQLEPGDVIFVPSRHGVDISDISRILLGITGMLRLLQ